MKFTIYHNPDCSKSCNALNLITLTSEEVEIINYLQNPPSENELKKLITMLGISAHELIRKNEPEFLEYADKNLTEDDFVKLMIKHPVLIQRPIVVKGDKAIVLRPPYTLEDI